MLYGTACAWGAPLLYGGRRRASLRGRHRRGFGAGRRRARRRLGLNSEAAAVRSLKGPEGQQRRLAGSAPPGARCEGPV